jgi:hypothetical protein
VVGGALQPPGEAEGNLRLDLRVQGPLEVEGASHHHGVGEHSIDGRVQRHLAALRLRGESHLQADDPLAPGDAERDAGVHHLVGLGEVEVRCLERQPLHFPAVPPRVVQLTRQALDVHLTFLRATPGPGAGPGGAY